MKSTASGRWRRGCSRWGDESKNGEEYTVKEGREKLYIWRQRSIKEASLAAVIRT